MRERDRDARLWHFANRARYFPRSQPRTIQGGNEKKEREVLDRGRSDRVVGGQPASLIGNKPFLSNLFTPPPPIGLDFYPPDCPPNRTLSPCTITIFQPRRSEQAILSPRKFDFPSRDPISLLVFPLFLFYLSLWRENAIHPCKILTVLTVFFFFFVDTYCAVNERILFPRILGKDLASMRTLFRESWNFCKNFQFHCTRLKLKIKRLKWYILRYKKEFRDLSKWYFTKFIHYLRSIKIKKIRSFKTKLFSNSYREKLN